MTRLVFPNASNNFKWRKLTCSKTAFNLIQPAHLRVGPTNLQYQQNLMVRKIAILLLSTNHWPTLKGQVALVQSALDKVRPGEFVRVEIQRRE